MISGHQRFAGSGGWCVSSRKGETDRWSRHVGHIRTRQQGQRLYLKRGSKRLIWGLERTETEIWVEPPNPVLEAVSALVTADRPLWNGTATKLVEALQTELKLNALAMRLNVRTERLASKYYIRYESDRTHAGRRIGLTLGSTGS